LSQPAFDPFAQTTGTSLIDGVEPTNNFLGSPPATTGGDFNAFQSSPPEACGCQGGFASCSPFGGQTQAPFAGPPHGWANTTGNMPTCPQQNQSAGWPMGPRKFQTGAQCAQPNGWAALGSACGSSCPQMCQGMAALQGQMMLGQLSSAQMPQGQMPLGQMPSGQMPHGQMPSQFGAMGMTMGNQGMQQPLNTASWNALGGAMQGQATAPSSTPHMMQGNTAPQGACGAQEVDNLMTRAMEGVAKMSFEQRSASSAQNSARVPMNMMQGFR